MRCIGIDLGFGRTKMFAGKGCRANFPSVASSQVPVHTFGHTLLNPIVVRGITYLVGEEAARHARSVEDTRRTDYVCSPSWFALLGTALRIALFDALTDTVTIGLPPGDLGPEKEQLVRRELRETPITVKSTGETYVLDRTKILIVPQGAGIYFCYAMSNHVALTQNVAVIDVGHHTLDLIYMAYGTYIESGRRRKTSGSHGNSTPSSSWSAPALGGSTWGTATSWRAWSATGA